MLGKTVTILLVAGETSGDVHGSSLIREMKKLNRHLEFFGIGGDRLKKEGVNLIEHVDKMAVMGFTEVFRKYAFLRQTYRRIIHILKHNRPARAILIDYPGFNLRLAKELKNCEIPVTYFISPQLWAWREKRIDIIRECVDQVLCIFPFEERWFRERGVDAIFVGHPLMEQNVLRTNKKKFFKLYDIGEEKINIALMPGSRQQEVDKHLSIMIESVNILNKRGMNVHGIVGKAPGIDLEGFYLQNKTVVDDFPQLTLAFADFGIVASGTASLEAALYSTPTVVVYKMSAVSWLLVKMFAKVSFVSMTNLVAQKEVLPEILQRRASAQHIADELQLIIKSTSIKDKMIQGMKEVREKMGGPGATGKAAQLIIDKLSNKK